MQWPPEQPEPDSLDHLLTEAQWPEPAPDVVGRLRGRWRLLVGERLQRKRRLRALALAAAGILLAAGLTLWIRSERGANGPRLTSFAIPSASPPAMPVTPSEDSPPAKKPVRAKPRTKSRSPASADYSERRRLVAERQMRKSQNRRVAAGAAKDAALPEELAALRIEAVRNMAQRCDASTLARLARQEQSLPLRQELLLMLLARSDLQSVQVFLECVANPHTSAAALDCLALLPRPPVETLFQCLRGPLADQRVAAAQAIGRLNEPAVFQGLIAMVARGTYRIEALIALLSSSEPVAQQFVADAAQDPALSATLWNAQRQYQRHLISWRS